MSKTVRYSIIIERAENNFCAYSPDVPGCVTAGDSIAEVKQLMAEALELYFEDMREDKEPIPQPKTLVDYVEVIGFEEEKDFQRMSLIELAYYFLANRHDREAFKELRIKSEENGITISPEASMESIHQAIENINISND